MQRLAPSHLCFKLSPQGRKKRLPISIDKIVWHRDLTVQGPTNVELKYYNNRPVLNGLGLEKEYNRIVYFNRPCWPSGLSTAI